MNTTDKVMSWLEGLAEPDWRDFHSDSEVQNIAKSALALLKEDCHNCKLECLLQKYDQLKEKYDELLKEQEPYISKETRLNRDEYCRVGDVLDCFDGMDMKADEVFHAVCLIEWAMSKRSVPLDQLLKEQKTGHWILLENCSNSGVYCSECQTKVFDNYPFKKKFSYFCPHCGTRMEGKIERR